MENQTRYDLNAAIENWRNELAAQPNLASDDRRELETHLRDAIAGFQQRGLNDEESFWLARKRVGQPQQLEEEFVKADPAKVWRERAFWMVAAIIAIQIWGSVVNFLFTILTTSSGRYYHFQSISLLLRMLLYVLPVVWIMALIANGRITTRLAKFSLFFRSQLRLASVAALLVITSHFLQGFASWWQLRATGLIVKSGIIQIWQLAVSTMIVHLILVGLLVWLMPTKNRKTPKRA
jgi:hypothetical protein